MVSHSASMKNSSAVNAAFMPGQYCARPEIWCAVMARTLSSDVSVARPCRRTCKAITTDCAGEMLL